MKLHRKKEKEKGKIEQKDGVEQQPVPQGKPYDDSFVSHSEGPVDLLLLLVVVEIVLVVLDVVPFDILQL